MISAALNAAVVSVVKNGFPQPPPKTTTLPFSKCLIDTQLDKIVLNLRDGVHTKLSDKALNLSGGQRQRILLARALYQRPSIIILDESTNAIDFNSQNEIFDTIFSGYSDTTFIVVCHTEINLKLFNNIICI